MYSPLTWAYEKAEPEKGWDAHCPQFEEGAEFLKRERIQEQMSLLLFQVRESWKFAKGIISITFHV